MATPTSLPASFSSGAVLTAAQMNDLRGAFRVLQVVQNNYATGVTNNTNVLADTGLSCTITPAASTNKVLVIVSQNGVSKEAGNANSAVYLSLRRGATELTAYNSFLFTGVSELIVATWTFVYLDSPSTTSATTYKTQFSNMVNAAGVNVQRSIGAGFQNSFMQLLEISA